MIRTLAVYNEGDLVNKKIAKNLVLVLGPGNICSFNDFRGDFKGFDVFILPVSLSNGEIDGDISNFIKENLTWIKEKKVVLYYSEILLKNNDESLLEGIKKMLGYSVILCQYCSGELKDVMELSLKIKRIYESNIKKLENRILKSEIEKFIGFHNTCVLSTSNNEIVRGTPIEYIYDNGKIYILTEGGEKFCNILLNPNVCVCINDEFKGMDSLAGMQIFGKASLVERDSCEYKDVLELRKINYDVLKKYPIIMNMLKIDINRVDFLYYKFKNMGVEAKQTYYF